MLLRNLQQNFFLLSTLFLFLFPSSLTRLQTLFKLLLLLLLLLHVEVISHSSKRRRRRRRKAERKKEELRQKERRRLRRRYRAEKTIATTIACVLLHDISLAHPFHFLLKNSPLSFQSRRRRRRSGDGDAPAAAAASLKRPSLIFQLLGVCLLYTSPSPRD